VLHRLAGSLAATLLLVLLNACGGGGSASPPPPPPPPGDFELVVSTSGSGAVVSNPAGIDCDTTCSAPFASGTAVTLQATPVAGWVFSAWSGACTGSQPTCNVTMSGATSAVATFTAIRHALTVSVTGSGTVGSSPSGISCPADCTENYAEGETVTLTAAPSGDQRFDGWSGAGCSGTGSCVVTVSAAASVSAAFSATPSDRRTLSVTVGGNGSGTVTSSPAGIACGTDCSESFITGTAVTLTAAPTAGSTFAGWSGACAGTGSCAVTMSAPVAVGATFTRPVHLLTVSRSGSGSVTSAPAGISCGADCTESLAQGTVVTLTAAPASGWRFAAWSGGGCTGTGPCALTLNAATTVTATFTPITHTLTVALSGSGSVASSPVGIACGVDCNEAYAAGTAVTLTPTPASGWAFAGWAGSCTGTGACVVTMSAARTVTANFARITHVLTVARSGSGTVTSSPAGISCGADCTEPIAQGTVVTLSAAPATNWTFSGWSGGGCTGTGNCVVTVNAATTVTATFTQPSFALSVTRSGTGTGTVTSSPAGVNCGTDCSESYLQNTVVTLTATPAANNTFAGWSGACTGTSTCSVTMSAARSVTATFNTTASLGLSARPSNTTCFAFDPPTGSTASLTLQAFLWDSG
jgi:hypothetical protein